MTATDKKTTDPKKSTIIDSALGGFLRLERLDNKYYLVIGANHNKAYFIEYTLVKEALMLFDQAIKAQGPGKQEQDDDTSIN